MESEVSSENFTESTQLTESFAASAKKGKRSFLQRHKIAIGIIVLLLILLVVALVVFSGSKSGDSSSSEGDFGGDFSEFN